MMLRIKKKCKFQQMFMNLYKIENSERQRKKMKMIKWNKIIYNKSLR